MNSFETNLYQKLVQLKEKLRPFGSKQLFEKLTTSSDFRVVSFDQKHF